jgi:RNA polymerase sigma-70 factor (ECF subfamily)
MYRFDVESLTAEVNALPAPAKGPGVPNFAAMVREHWDAVYRLLQSLTPNVHDVEDLTQETFLRAWKRIDSFKPGTNLRSWLLKIASNAFLDEQRKRKRSKTGSLETEPPGRSEGTGRGMELGEEFERLQRAMGELTELTRLVFHLRAAEELSFKEIAEVAGTTEQAARWHMHHARTTLLKLMGEEEQ